MIGRKNKGPSLAIATTALGGAGSVTGSGLGGLLGYVAGFFETLGGAIPAVLTASAGSLGTSATSLVTSFGGSLLTSATSLGTSFSSIPVNSLLDSLSSSGVTSLPITPISNFLLLSIPALSTSLIPFI